MKLAWLCYEHDDDYLLGYDITRAIILFQEPRNFQYAKVVQIVYSEIQEPYA